MLKNVNVAVYVSGSIAAYKSLAMVRLLKRAGANVQVVMTKAACRFVTPLSFTTLAKTDTVTDQDAGAHGDQITHIQVAQWSDLALAMPADANLIAKLANGIADDIVSTTLLATAAPKVIVPAMNDQMWNHPATQRNVATLKADGATVLEPATGFLAEGYQAKGRMVEPDAVLASLDALQPANAAQPLAGKRVLVTAGGTRQPIDPVRFITNASSGKMGMAIAQAARAAGAEVTVLYADISVPLPVGVAAEHVSTSAEMAAAVLKRFPDCDVLVMAAAIADFAPVNVADQKLKKNETNGHLTLEFKPAQDILKAVAEIKREDQYTVGFAAETHDLQQNAAAKLAAKHLNMLVANDVSNRTIGFGSDDNQVTFLKPGQAPVQTPVLTKAAVADRLVALISADLT